ncbi:MAG: permease-like cell division protein FtsX [Firmicutes bacterium]|nr:permease-like cell division protein FtsX [Bacillota bacterium]
MAARLLREMWTILTEGVVDFLRTPGIAVASVGTAAVALLLVGAYLVAATNIAHLSRTVSSQVDMRLFLSAGMRPKAERLLAARVRRVAGVRSVTFISKAEALAQLKREFAGNGAVEAVLAEGNPLLDSLDVRTASPAVSDRVARALGRLPGVAHLVYPGQTVARLGAVLTVVRWAGLVLASLLALSSFLVTSNAIRLAVLGRRREIEIMLLVGATRAMVRGPFLVEGMLLGALGGVVATVVTVVGYGAVARALTAAAPFLPIVPPAQVNARLAFDLVLGGVVLGWVGALFALRRLIRVASEA